MYEIKLNLLTFLLENDDIFCKMSLIKQILRIAYNGIFVIIVLSLCFPFMFGMVNEKLNGLENTIELFMI